MAFRHAILISLLGLATPNLMRADVLASAPPGGLTNINPNYLGEGFTVKGTGTYSSITFEFLTTSGTPFAAGTGFLLTQAYGGALTGLNSSTAGYLGSAAAIGNMYSFGSNVQLNANTTYYFYENALVSTGTIAGATSSIVPPEAYYAGSGGNFTAQPGFTWAFQVSSAPEISTSGAVDCLVLLGGGILIIGLPRRLRI